jgi:hypothetical protein
VKQEISEFTKKEHDWIAAQIEGATRFINAFSPTDTSQPLTLEALDRAFAAWLGTRETDNKLVNAAINCVGVAFGQFLVDGLGLAWVIASDNNGSDLAVHGLPGRGDVLIYPANFVAKRWERGETNFLEASYKQIAKQVQSVAQGNTPEPTGKPWWKFW